MLSAALGKALWISHQLQLGGSEGSTWAAQSSLPMPRAAGGRGGSPPWALTPGTLWLCPAEGFCKEGKVCSSPGSTQRSVKVPVLPVDWERPRGLSGSVGR